MRFVSLKKKSLYKAEKYGSKVATYQGIEEGKVVLCVNNQIIRLSEKTFRKDWA